MDDFSKYYDAINAQQQANNAWSAEQAQRAMDYQREMSNTAHQREVADLKAAGLNPVLSSGGSGATSGSGLAASAGNENVSALYGLAKQAIEANIKQAEAMANSAKYISGSTGSKLASTSSDPLLGSAIAGALPSNPSAKSSLGRFANKMYDSWKESAASKVLSLVGMNNKQNREALKKSFVLDGFYGSPAAGAIYGVANAAKRLIAKN